MRHEKAHGVLRLAHWWADPGPWISGFRVPGVLELLLVHWGAGQVPDTAGCRVLVSRSLCQPTSEWGQVLGQLGEDSKVSQSWCWPPEGWAGSSHRRLWGCSGPGISVCLLGGTWAQEILDLVPASGGWSWVPGSLASGPTAGSDWGMRVLIPGLLPPCW